MENLTGKTDNQVLRNLSETEKNKQRNTITLFNPLCFAINPAWQKNLQDEIHTEIHPRETEAWIIFQMMLSMGYYQKKQLALKLMNL